MAKLLNAHWFFFIATVLVLTLNFGEHKFSSLSLEKFLDGEFRSEGYALSRLVYNLDHGHEAKGGFMVRYEAIDGLLKSTDKEDFRVFKEAIQGEDKMQVYYSHTGLQDDVLLPLWGALSAIRDGVLERAREGSRWQERMQDYDLYYFIMITHWVMALVNALIIGLLLLWVARTFKTPVAWGTLIFTLIALPVITYYGRSVWWMMGSWFLPLIIMLWWIHLRPAFRWFDAVGAGILAGAAVTLKVSFGYEFTSTVMMGILIAPLFYAVRDQWSVRQWVTASFIVGVLALAGFAAGLYGHFAALEAHGMDPMKVLEHSFEKRAHGGENVPGGLMTRSVEASVFAVIGGYLVSTKELMPPQILIMAPFLWLLWRRRKTLMEDRVFAALCAAIGAGFIGAISMLVILKGHAYVHGYDIIIWSLPMNIFIGIVYAREIYARCAALGRCSGSKP